MARTLKDILEAKSAARAALVKLRDDTEARATAEKRSAWTKEEDAAFAKASADYDAVAAEEARARKFEEIDANRGERALPGREDVRPGKGSGGPEVTDETRTRALAGWFAEQSGMGANDEEVEAARACRLNLRAKTLTIPILKTRGIRAVQAAHRTLHGDERARGLREIEMRDMSAGSGPEGGYLTAPEEMVRQVELAMVAYGGIYERAQVIRTAGANPLTWPSADDTSNTGEWLAEAGSAVATSASVDPTAKKTQWLAHKVSSKPILASYELLRDSVVDLPSLLGEMLGIRIGRAKATAFMSGSGAGKPRGINMDSVLGKTAAGAAAITTDELIDLLHSVSIVHRNMGDCAWVMKDSTAALIRKLKDSTNQYLWQPGLVAGKPDQLFGFPVVISEDMPAATTGLKSVLFGRLSAYKVREVGAIRLRRLDELYAETDQTGFIAFHEADGGLLNPGDDPIKHLIQA